MNLSTLRFTSHAFQVIQQMLPPTKAKLEQVGKLLADAIEKMIIKEKYINNQMDHMVRRHQKLGEIDVC